MNHKYGLLPITVLLALCGSLTCCARQPAHDVQHTPSVPIRAVYLVPTSGGSIAATDLASHQEVAVVHDQADLESLAATRVAIWIDKDAADMADAHWVRSKAGDKYPVALIGYNNSLYSFRETLPMGIGGPYVDWSKVKLTPGFSVWMVTSSTASSVSAYDPGFEGTPTVQAVLSETDRLLKKSQP